jgi:hypothetical protein
MNVTQGQECQYKPVNVVFMRKPDGMTDDLILAFLSLGNIHEEITHRAQLYGNFQKRFNGQNDHESCKGMEHL